MIRLTHSSPRRTLGHLRKLQREGESLQASPCQLTPRDEARWDIRVWRCLDQLTGRDAFEGAVELDLVDSGIPNLLDFAQPPSSAADLDQLLRRRISRRIVTLASVIEKVEALCEPDRAGPTSGGAA